MARMPPWEETREKAQPRHRGTRMGIRWAAGLFLVLAAPLHGAIPDKERDALDAFYKAAGGPGWNYNCTEKPWYTTGVPECEWAGVNCNPARTEVQGLELDGFLDNPCPGKPARRNLVGRLPALLGDLEHLVTLALSNNQLTGTVPTRLADTTLAFFFADNNQLTGDLTWLADLPLLQKVSLRFNRLSGPLPASLSPLAMLQESAARGERHRWRTAGSFRPEQSRDSQPDRQQARRQTGR